MKPLPENFNARPMGYPRWLLLTVNQNNKPNGGLAGMLDARYISEARAKAITQTVSDALFAPLVIVKEHRGAKRNPTLVHHGRAAAAWWHVLRVADNAPIADLYAMPGTVARKAVQAMASAMGQRLVMLNNDNTPAHLRDHMVSAFAGPRNKTRNPERAPKIGERWYGHRHGHVTIMGLDPFRKRVQIRGSDGNRVWLDRLEWAGGSFKPERGVNRNPGRPVVGEYWSRLAYPQHLVRVTRVSRADGGSVAYDVVTGRGQLMGSSSLPLGAFVDGHEPLPASSPYRKKPERAVSRNPGKLDAATRAMILKWLPKHPTAADVERAAKWMRDSLRVGSITQCRAFVREAMVASPDPAVRMARYDNEGRIVGNPGGNLAPGTRVAATVHGVARKGTVIEQRSGGIVWVRWDGSARKAWMHRESLTLTNPKRVSRNAKRKPAKRRKRPRTNPKLERRYKSEKSFRTALAKFTVSGELVDWYGDDHGWVIRLRRIVNKTNPRGKRFSVRKIEDWVGGQGYTQAVFEVVDSGDKDRVVFRSYNQHDARVESAYRNKFGVKGNPTVKVSGMLRVRRVRRGRPPLSIVRKPRAARAPRAPRASSAKRFEPGEPVTVPYSGRSSYFGRRVKRQTEPAQVMGYIDSSAGGELVQVSVRRGKGATVHEFPAHLVRRRPRRDYRSEGEKHPEVRARLEAAVGGDTNKGLHLLELAHAESDAAEKMARAMQPGEPDFARARRAMSAAARRAQALESIVTKLQESEPGYVDPFAVANRRRPSLRRKRRNPSSQVERGLETFAKWHEFDAHRISHMKGPDKRIPDTLVALGKLKSFVYESDKYTGKPTLYEHATKRPHPVLASDPSGRNTFIVGGRMKITGDGFVN